MSTASATSPPPLPSSIVLRYWDVRGRAEVVRLLFHDAGVAFTDERVSMAVAFDGTWSNELKPNAAVCSLHGYFPVLQWGADLQLPQSLAIARFVAKKLGYLEGLSDEQEAVAAAAGLFTQTDLMRTIVESFYVPVDELDAKLAAKYVPALTDLARRNEAIIAAAAKPFLSGGAKPTLGDFWAFAGLDVARHVGIVTADKHPHVTAFLAAMAARPGIAAYLASPERPASLGGSPWEAAAIEKIRAAFADKTPAA